jgi:hypothetical protein
MSKKKIAAIGIAATIVLAIALQPVTALLYGVWLVSEVVWQVTYFQLPEIARNLPRSFAEGKVEFNRRVQHDFPVGISEPDLTARLSAAGFRVNENGAFLHRSRFPCELRWQVRWKTYDAKVTEVVGDYGEAGCL